MTHINIHRYIRQMYISCKFVYQLPFLGFECNLTKKKYVKIIRARLLAFPIVEEQHFDGLSPISPHRSFPNGDNVFDDR